MIQENIFLSPYNGFCILKFPIQLNLVDSKSSGPRKILRNTEASDKRITNMFTYRKNFSCKKYVETEFFLVIKIRKTVTLYQCSLIVKKVNMISKNTVSFINLLTNTV